MLFVTPLCLQGESFCCIFANVCSIIINRNNTNLQHYDDFHDSYEITEGNNQYPAPEDRGAIW